MANSTETRVSSLDPTPAIHAFWHAKRFGPSRMIKIIERWYTNVCGTKDACMQGVKMHLLKHSGNKQIKYDSVYNAYMLTQSNLF